MRVVDIFEQAHTGAIDAEHERLKRDEKLVNRLISDALADDGLPDTPRTRAAMKKHVEGKVLRQMAARRVRDQLEH